MSKNCQRDSQYSLDKEHNDIPLRWHLCIIDTQDKNSWIDQFWLVNPRSKSLLLIDLQFMIDSYRTTMVTLCTIFRFRWETSLERSWSRQRYLTMQSWWNVCWRGSVWTLSTSRTGEGGQRSIRLCQTTAPDVSAFCWNTEVTMSALSISYLVHNINVPLLVFY